MIPAKEDELNDNRSNNNSKPSIPDSFFYYHTYDNQGKMEKLYALLQKNKMGVLS